jgi:hypothetical protein
MLNLILISNRLENFRKVVHKRLHTYLQGSYIYKKYGISHCFYCSSKFLPNNHQLLSDLFLCVFNGFEINIKLGFYDTLLKHFLHC